MAETEEKIFQLQYKSRSNYSRSNYYESKLINFEDQGIKPDKNYNIKTLVLLLKRLKKVKEYYIY